uniref:Cytokine receptor n=1 Tax=Culex pipiens TaxID=7175 RepID=A0A8D8H0N4_CULPI
MKPTNALLPITRCSGFVIGIPRPRERSELLAFYYAKYANRNQLNVFTLYTVPISNEPDIGLLLLSTHENPRSTSIMLALVWMICAASNIALVTSNVIKPSGKITISPSVVDLDSNVTFYTVSCRLEDAQDGLDSSSLYIELQNERIKSEVINTTTIEAKIDLLNIKQSDVCYSKSFRCTYNDTTLDAKDIHVGRPPAPIEFQRNFKCFLFGLSEQYCEFTPLSNCDKAAEYRLFTKGILFNASCDLEKKNGTYFYSSNTTSCYFPASDNVTLILEAVNSIGSRTMYFTVNHDFVKLRGVSGTTLTDITSDSAVIRNNESNLKYVERSFDYQFMLISKYDTRLIDSTESNSSVFDYPIHNLNPFTEYKLGVRLRVIPRSVRLLDEEYWSGWSWTFFKTEARKPDVAPRTIPGAFSFKDHKGDRASLEVYWEPMLESQWNGPGFRYNVSAVSDTSQWFVPVNDSRDLPYEVATFEDITLDHYRILVSCYNDKGSFQGSTIMELFPPKHDLKPKIKKVSNNRQSFNVSWYPPSIETGISNYTVMYCNLTSSSSCKDSIRFVTVPSTNTSFSVSSPTVLNFAVSANYPNHSSDFSWQQCLVSPGADIGSPQFEPCNVTDTSFDIRMTTACSSSSLYELLEVYVLTLNGSHIWNTSLEHPQERISIGGLSPDTEYVVKVVAFDESGNPHETSKSVQTAPKFTTMQLTLFFLCGVLLVSALTMGTTRKVNSLRNIHVEMPVALQTLFGIDGEETKMILRSDLTESVERTPRIYVELPSKGYTNIPMVIPEEDDEFEEGSLLKVESIRSSADTENNKNDVFKQKLRDTTLKASDELQAENIQPVQSNGYVLAAQFMTPKENPAPQLPKNVTNGSTSGYIVFK